MDIVLRWLRERNERQRQNKAFDSCAMHLSHGHLNAHDTSPVPASGYRGAASESRVSVYQIETHA